jgi:hypothetical protein
MGQEDQRLLQMLQQLHRVMPQVNDLVHELHPQSSAEAFDAAAEALEQAAVIARELGRPASPIGCQRHPGAPPDPTAPEGWGNCLLCNTHRRRTMAASREHATRPDLNTASTPRRVRG